MQTTLTKENTKLTVAVEGRIDTVTAPDLEKTLDESLAGVTELILDFAEVPYISSAGLRVILTAQKTMIHQGSMEIHNVNELLREIFETTGFDEFLTIR